MSEHFKHDGFDFTVEIMGDDVNDLPWQDDGVGIVTDWRNGRDKRPWERVLNQDHGSYRFYDMQASREKAIKEGWGVPPEEAKGLTHKQIIALAIEKDFKRLRAWCNDEWRYVGVVVINSENGKQSSLWGIESDSTDYIEEVKKELAEELLSYSKFEREMRKASQTL